MRYRRDIDGLRAIAIVPVVIYHLAQSVLRGGFVGVDVFFVISGYLIGGTVIAEARAGRFSARDFWGRRFRRIAPAYAGMLVFVSAVVLLRYFPGETENYGRSLIAAVLSVSNLFFWSTINYFNPAGDTFPLLHTWSLAVEEQFYLFFPLAVLALLRWAPDRIERTVLLMFLASLALCVGTVFVWPTFGFYWIFPRAWELLLGTMLALDMAPRLERRWQREAAGFAGIALIGGSMLSFDPFVPFPGYLALAPCLGAALVIHSGRHSDTLVARALSLPPVRFIGLISYSLYLWQWPLIAFQRADWLLISSNSKLVERGVVLVVALVAATTSWWLVERPTRDRSRFSMRALLLLFGTALAALAAFGAVLIVGGGLPGRYPADARRVAGYLDYDFNREMRVGRCLLSDRMPLSQFDRIACLPARPARPTYLLIGDSHAGALAPGMIAAYPDANILQVTASSCLPVLVPQPLAAARSCDAVMRFGLIELSRQRRIDGIWLYGRWGVGNLDDRVRDMLQTATQLQRSGHKVTVIGPNPEYRTALPRLLARALLRRDPGYPRAFQSPEPFEADARLKRTARSHGIRYVSIIDHLCNAHGCIVEAAPGVPMVFDNDHFTRDGGALIAHRLASDLIGR